MLILLKNKDDVTLDHVRLLLSFLLKDYLVSIFHPPFYLNSKLLTFLDQSLASTCLAIFCIHFTFTSTLCTWLLHLHLHDTHIHSLHGNSFASASWTCLSFTTFSTWTFTLAAINVALDIKGLFGTIIQLFKTTADLHLIRWTLSPIISFTTPNATISDNEFVITFHIAPHLQHLECYIYLVSFHRKVLRMLYCTP